MQVLAFILLLQFVFQVHSSPYPDDAAVSDASKEKEKEPSGLYPHAKHCFDGITISASEVLKNRSDESRKLCGSHRFQSESLYKGCLLQYVKILVINDNSPPPEATLTLSLAAIPENKTSMAKFSIDRAFVESVSLAEILLGIDFKANPNEKGQASDATIKQNVAKCEEHNFVVDGFAVEQPTPFDKLKWDQIKKLEIILECVEKAVMC